jgi:SAM-dependent methyltransferase
MALPVTGRTSQVATSLIYHSTLLYELVMMALYGRHYFARYRAVAGLIPAGSSVVDVCCGPATLYHRYLRPKGVRYTGLDLNDRFLRRLKRRGASGQVWDLRTGGPLPRADYVVMQASLYHFLPDPAPVVDRMLAAARARVVLAEPVRNLATSRVPVLAALARRHTDPGSGAAAGRFTEANLDKFFARYAERVREAFLIPGGREKVYVLAAGS